MATRIAPMSEEQIRRTLECWARSTETVPRYYLPALQGWGVAETNPTNDGFITVPALPAKLILIFDCEKSTAFDKVRDHERFKLLQQVLHAAAANSDYRAAIEVALALGTIDWRAFYELLLTKEKK